MEWDSCSGHPSARIDQNCSTGSRAFTPIALRRTYMSLSPTMASDVLDLQISLLLNIPPDVAALLPRRSTVFFDDMYQWFGDSSLGTYPYRRVVRSTFSHRGSHSLRDFRLLYAVTYNTPSFSYPIRSLVISQWNSFTSRSLSRIRAVEFSHTLTCVSKGDM
jgi:hypothetical protein